MARVSADIHIAADIDRVFDVFVDIPNWANQVGAIKKIEMLTDGKVGVGTRFKETRVIFKKEATETMEVTSFDRPTQYTLEAQSCGAAYVTVHRFTSEGNGTKVTVEMTATPVTFFAKVMSPLSALMLKSCAKMFVRDLQDVKAVCEGGTPTGAVVADPKLAGGSA